MLAPIAISMCTFITIILQVEYLQQNNRELDAKLRASLAKQREDMEANKVSANYQGPTFNIEL